MKYADYPTILDNHIAAHPLIFGDGESVLTLLYESYEELQVCSSVQIKEDFHELYRLLNGVPLTELDRIINPVCTSAGIMRNPALSTVFRWASDWLRKFGNKHMDRLQNFGDGLFCHPHPSQVSPDRWDG